MYAGGVAAAKDVEAARQQLALDRAEVVQARADVAQAESDLRAAQAQGPVAQAQLAAADAKVGAARRNLANAVLRAPVSGVVTAIFKHVGESADPSSPVLSVGPGSTDTVTLTATGTDARKIHPGDAVTFVAASAPGSGRGIVASVLPNVDPTTQSATIVVSGVPAGAVPGDAVEASITVAIRRGIMIPSASIVDDPQTGKSIVFVRTPSSAGPARFVAREITVAAGDDRRSLVSGGLRAGEQIAGEGAYDLLAPTGGG